MIFELFSQRNSPTQRLDELAFQLSADSAKQFIALCSGLALLVPVGFGTMLPILLQNRYICIPLVLAFGALIVSQYYAVQFLLALTARATYHRDLDILTDVARRDMKRVIRAFQLAMLLIFTSLVMAAYTVFTDSAELKGQDTQSSDLDQIAMPHN